MAGTAIRRPDAGFGIFRAKKPSNPLVLGGDVHCTWVADLKPDFDDPRSRTVATEFVGTSITSQLGRTQAEQDAIKQENPHITYADLTRRGYVRMELTPGRARADLRGLENVTRPDARIETMATFVVGGRPGGRPACLSVPASSSHLPRVSVPFTC